MVLVIFSDRLKGTATTLALVISGFSNLSGTYSQILPPKRDNKHPRHIRAVDAL